MQRMLCIVGGMNAGGAETFIMKIYRAIDKTKYQFDFAVATQEKCFYDDEILSYGGRIFRITPKSAGLIKNFKCIKSIVKDNGYQIVMRVSQHSLSALELLAAKKGGAKTRVFRSSNSNTTTGSKRSFILHKLCMFMPKRFANVRIAPSTEAAEYMFGKGCIKKKKAFLIKNAIDLSKYTFSSEERIRLRRELSIDDCFVVGHVGRFNQQKNHVFLINVFCEIKKRNNSAKLLLVGIGEKQQEIQRLVSEKGLSNDVIFTGVRSDIPSLMSAMDVFLFPSLYEGMPNTVIEAQACGLPCVVSDAITKEAKVTNILKFVPLSSTLDNWAEVALSFNGIRESTHDEMRKKEYDISSSVHRFIELVFDNDLNDEN